MYVACVLRNAVASSSSSSSSKNNNNNRNRNSSSNNKKKPFDNHITQSTDNSHCILLLLLWLRSASHYQRALSISLSLQISLWPLFRSAACSLFYKTQKKRSKYSKKGREKKREKEKERQRESQRRIVSWNDAESLEFLCVLKVNLIFSSLY